MITDALLSFVPIGGNASLVGAAGVAIQVGNVIDLLGLGAGVAPNDGLHDGSGGDIIGNVTNFGAPDAMGVGTLRPQLVVSVGTTFQTSDACTLDLALQAAPDAGSPTWQPGTWQTIETTGALTAAQLTAGTVIMRLPWVPPFPANLRPRFLRLYGIVPSTLLFTAGTIAYALVSTGRDDQFNKYAANNYGVQ